MMAKSERASPDLTPALPEICGRLRALRLELGLGVEAMAARLHVSRTALYRYERGEAPKLATLQRVASVLEVPLPTLLGGGVEWFGTAPGFFERLRQIEAQADHIFALFGPTSWLLVSDAYAEHVLAQLQTVLPSARDVAELRSVLQERRATYARRRPSVVSLLSLHDVLVPPATAGPDGARLRALARAEWSHISSLAEKPPRGVQIGVLRDRIPSAGFSLARNAGGTTVAISPFRFGDPVNLRVGAASITSEAQAVRVHEVMADALWSTALRGTDAAAVIRGRLGRRRTA